MNPLISPQKVFELAFSPQEILPAGSLSQSLVVLAQERYLRPVVGEALCEALEAGSYPRLLEEFVAPVIAFGARLQLLPSLRQSLSTGGLVEPSGSGWRSLDEEHFASLMRALRNRLEGLRRRLDEELERLDKAHEIPEYSPAENIRRRCRIHGGFVQVV